MSHFGKEVCLWAKASLFEFLYVLLKCASHGEGSKQAKEWILGD